MQEILKITARSRSIATLAEVEQRLRHLQDSLPRTELAPLAPFNTAYLLVITEMCSRIGVEYFDNEAAVQAFESRFVRYYLEALHEYSSGRLTSPPWEAVFTACRKNTHNPLGYLVLGVNAHVNHDLCLSLLDVQATRAFSSDLLRTTRIISQLSRDIIRGCGIKTHSNWLLPLGMRIVVRLWSLRAWRMYRKLTTGAISRETVARRSSRMGTILFRAVSYIF